MKKIIVLGAGLIGKAIAIDLCKDFEVACADKQMCALEQLSPRFPITPIPCDFKNTASLAETIRPFDLVIIAVPGFMGFETLKTVISEKKDLVDISFFPENPFLLDKLAKQKGVTAVVDCGVAPGLCNILAGHHHRQAPLSAYECMVGGLPVNPEWPYKYKAVFSPIDVLEEYTRPARYREGSLDIVKAALTDIETISFDETGELEAFNTDGLRTLAVTMPRVANMKEKTIRYPGQANLMRIFRESGFFGKEAIDLKGQKVVPLELTARLLFQKWKLRPGEEDFTVMRVKLEDEQKQVIYTLYDRYDKESQTTSMARTTGYTCTAVARLVANQAFTRKGICPPEYVGENEAGFTYVLDYLATKNIHCTKTITKKEIIPA
jgi:lysine 6-dehydrogenase